MSVWFKLYDLSCDYRKSMFIKKKLLCLSRSVMSKLYFGIIIFSRRVDDNVLPILTL